MSGRRPRIRSLWLAIGWAMVGAIIWLSLTPSPPKVDFQQSDKLDHFIGYGTLMFWFSGLYPHAKTRIAYAAAFVGMGIALEFAQGALGYRNTDVLDMLANTTGVVLGWAAALIRPKLLR